MRPLSVACAALALSAVASADYATQTDWSGGGGVGGPVSQWDSTYSEAEAVNHYLPGSLGLGIVREMSEHIPLIPSGALAHDPLWGASTSTATSICWQSVPAPTACSGASSPMGRAFHGPATTSPSFPTSPVWP